MVRKKLSRERWKKIGERAKDAFRRGAAAATIAAATTLGSAGCSDTIHVQVPDQPTPNINVEPPEVNVTVEDQEQLPQSEMCSDSTSVVIGSRGQSATVNRGESVYLPNNYRLNLQDVEANTQTAFFTVLNPDNAIVDDLDMVERVGYTLEFSEGVEPVVVELAACQVRSGHTFGEVSVTLVSDVEIETSGIECTPDTRNEVEENIDFWQQRGDIQHVNTVYINDCEGNNSLLSQTSLFSNPLEDVGLHGVVFQDKIVARILEGSWVLLSANQDGIRISKEEATGILVLNEELSNGEITVSLVAVELDDENPMATVSIEHIDGEMGRDISPGQTIEVDFGGESYFIHAYHISPSYTFGSSWAHLALLTTVRDVENEALNSFPSGDYYFSMSFDDSGALTSWDFVLAE